MNLPLGLFFKENCDKLLLNGYVGAFKKQVDAIAFVSIAKEEYRVKLEVLPVLFDEGVFYLVGNSEDLNVFRKENNESKS